MRRILRSEARDSGVVYAGCCWWLWRWLSFGGKVLAGSG